MRLPVNKPTPGSESRPHAEVNTGFDVLKGQRHQPLRHHAAKPRAAEKKGTSLQKLLTHWNNQHP